MQPDIPDIFEGPLWEDLGVGGGTGMTLGFIGGFWLGWGYDYVRRPIDVLKIAGYGSGIVGGIVVAVVLAGHLLAPVLT